MRYLLMLLVFLFGALQPFQAGVNSRMGAVLGDRFQAGFINGFVNTTLLVLVLLFLWRGFPAPSLLKQAPWWAFLQRALGGADWSAGLEGLLHALAWCRRCRGRG